MFRSSRDGLRAVFLDNVRHGDHARAACRSWRRTAAFCPLPQALRPALQSLAARRPFVGNEGEIAAAERLRRSASRSGRCRAARGNPSTSVSGRPVCSSALLQDRAGQADARCCCSSAAARRKQLASASRRPAGSTSVTARLALGDGAGLVQRDDLGACRFPPATRRS